MFLGSSQTLIGSPLWSWYLTLPSLSKKGRQHVLSHSTGLTHWSPSWIECIFLVVWGSQLKGPHELLWGGGGGGSGGGS